MLYYLSLSQSLTWESPWKHTKKWGFWVRFSPSVLAQDMDQYDQPAKWMAQLKFFGFGSFLWKPGSFVLKKTPLSLHVTETSASLCDFHQDCGWSRIRNGMEWAMHEEIGSAFDTFWHHPAGHQMLFRMFHPLQIGDDIAKSEFVKETERPEGAWGINRMRRVKIIYHPNWIVYTQNETILWI